MTEDARAPRSRRRTDRATVKPRRSHRKSRNGCAECRRRHIRCDKNHPTCFNCNTGDRTCVYPAGTVPEKSPSASVDDNTTEARRPRQSGTSAAPPHIPSPSRQSAAAVHQQPNTFSATDLVVFHHAQTAMEHVGLGRKGQFHKVLALGMRHRFRAPYLLDQIMALACTHLAFNLDSYPRDKTSVYLCTGLTAEGYSHHATALQTRAVESFNELMSPRGDIDIDSARFLFAGVLSLQSLAETLNVLRTQDTKFGDFMDGMVACFNLHRGVRASAGPTIRDFLPQSEELIDIMEFLNMTDDVDWRNSLRGDECQSLSALLDQSDLGEATLNACRGAAHSLQWSFDMCRGLSVQDGPHAAAAFAVTAPAAYVEALRRCCPEALLVLAYYGVLLHRCQEYWVYGDAGARMVRAIADHVGTYWKDAMRWPLQEIEAI